MRTERSSQAHPGAGDRRGGHSGDVNRAMGILLTDCSSEKRAKPVRLCYNIYMWSEANNTVLAAPEYSHKNHQSLLKPVSF